MLSIEEKDKISKEIFDDLDAKMEKILEEDRYKDFYSKFNNFPNNTKNTIYSNAFIAIGLIILLFLSIFKFNYFNALFIFVIIALELYFFIRIFSVFYYFKNIDFVTFTGTIDESYPVGSKITRNLHYIIKLRNDEDKILCCRYYDKEALMYNQSITVFIRKNEEIKASDYGPMIESYIAIVPTDDINTKMKLDNIRNDTNNENVDIENYLNDKKMP